METRTVRETSVTLPGLDDDDLDAVASLDERDRLAEFIYADAHLRELSLSGTQLMTGRITGVTAQRAHVDKVTLNSVQLSGCDLSNLRWSDSKLSRVVFTDCKLLGAVLEEVTLDDVLFERCRFDYATFDHVRASGPVIFSACSLRETVFTRPDLTKAAVDGCDLHLAMFDGGTFRGFDLRGNDLSGVRGVNSLRKVTIDETQLQGLAQAVAADLEVTFGENPA